MAWQPTSRRELPDLLSFLLKEEWRCVAFTARLKRSFRRGARVFTRTGAGGVDGAVMITHGGLVLPLLREPGQVAFPQLVQASTTLHSIMGVARDVRAVEQVLTRPVSTAVDYHLMALEKRHWRPSGVSPLPGLAVRRAVPADAGRLFPLQQGYELEEVVIHPELYQRQDSYLHLRQALHQELVLMAELHGRPVAKAGTNARGYHASQVGGVYTLPGERNRGIGLRIMEELLRAIFAAHECACLFVKKANPAALALYRRLGFQIRDDYRISYFGL